MSRRRNIIKKDLLPDVKYNHGLIAKFINCVMFSGKKSVAENIVYQAVEGLAEKLGEAPMEAFEKSLSNIRPMVEVRSRRVGGATYQVPVEIRADRSIALSLRWLINAAKTRKNEKTMSRKLLAELIDAHNNKGGAVKKREDTHKMAEANKAFAHYRW